MKSVRWIMSYILVATLGLWLAFAVSMKVMTPARSQDAPTSGDLPEEFLKEIESTQVPGGEKKAEAPTKPAQQEPVAEEEPPAPPIQPMVETGGGDPNMGYGDGATASQPPMNENYSDGYFYDPSGKRDPFIPFKVIRPQQADTGGLNEVLEPLQRWELERLQVVGILWEVKTPRAMIRDPDGVVFTITKNSKIGRNEGFVAAIREGEVVILETRYEEGKAIKEPRIMEFRK
ncbi:fimbrial assembly protein [Bdellovibrio bacteriovorus W]|nr:fimbrial assembly protein [Bdellovibrio bacteriovorus W]